ncbi:hypothetical protein [Bradyrhizobium sp.]|uniref:hypothetical protein n=1 Tax=Bradyrhizobium sp. TaxID=376 RepID=UPI003448F2D7
MAIEAERNAVEKRSRAESDRWEKHKEKLQGALHRPEPAIKRSFSGCRLAFLVRPAHHDPERSLGKRPL